MIDPHNLLIQALNDFQAARLIPAEQSCTQILALDTANVDALHLLALVRHQQRRVEEALPLLQQAIRLRPASVELHFNLGRMQQQLNRHVDAVLSFQNVTRLAPDHVEAWLRLGRLHTALGNPAQGVDCLQRALVLCPTRDDAYYSLGVAQTQLGQVAAAITAYQRCIEINPAHVAAHGNLGAVFFQAGKLEQAEPLFARAAALAPDDALQLNNWAGCLIRMGRLGAALETLTRVIMLQPSNAKAYADSSVALTQQAQHYASGLALGKALELEPGNRHYQDNFLFGSFAQAALSAEQVAARHFAWGRGIEAERVLSQALPYTLDRSATRPLRIGLVSGDLRRHPVGEFMLPIVAHHDPAAVRYIAFATHPVQDEVSERLRKHVQAWLPIHDLSSVAAATLIREQQIDVLIDLAGHTEGNRLDVFTLRPAPVQVSYLGYPGTTGLSCIDYRLTDQVADPVGMTEQLHSEKLWRLARCFICYSAPHDATQIGSVPCKNKGYVTFGAFNNLSKLNDPVLDAWARLLAAVAGSRLILKTRALDDAATRRSVVAQFAQRGIAAQRLVLLGHLDSANAHLSKYNDIDIALDTFPYAGTTTTCDALWMGVPVISMAGSAHVARVGASLLNSVGLSTCIANSVEDYIQKAAALAQAPTQLSELRAGLRARMQASVLMDGADMSRALERAFRAMWEAWLAQTNQ